MSTASGIRRPTTAISDGFTIVDNRWLRSPHLSAKEKGLLAYVLSHAGGYVLTIEQIIREMDDGKDSITNTINSLERKGLMIRNGRHRGEDGRLGAYNWDLIDPSTVDLAQRARVAKATKSASNTPGYDQCGKPDVEPERKTRTGSDQAEQDVSAGRDQCGFTTEVNPHSKEEQEEKTIKKNNPPLPPAESDGSAVPPRRGRHGGEESSKKPDDRLGEIVDWFVRRRPDWQRTAVEDALTTAVSQGLGTLDEAAQALRALVENEADPTGSPRRLYSRPDGWWWERVRGARSRAAAARLAASPRCSRKGHDHQPADGCVLCAGEAKGLMDEDHPLPAEEALAVARSKYRQFRGAAVGAAS